MTVGTREIAFVGAAGAALSGVLHTPQGQAKGSVVLVHCFTCSKDFQTMTRLADGLALAGWAAFRFDFTGLGESGGEFGETTVTTNVGDVSRAAVTLIELGFGPCRIVGHSLGGAAVILAAHRLKTVEKIVTIAAPSSAAHVTRLFAGEIDAIRRDGVAVVDIGGRPFRVGRDFLTDLERHDVLSAVAELDRPYLAIHAADDAVVDIEHGRALHGAAREPKRIIELDHGGHLFGDRAAAAELLSAITGFL